MWSGWWRWWEKQVLRFAKDDNQKSEDESAFIGVILFYLC
jgi:hypothetical protein